ncbi:MAG: hypothetical protein GWO20_12045 [Candidatus Korarchaeota archaeon]|nr:hypothetical protein [Candidatus Korarchaeota archaeon]NIU84162.1 hypothetical protein [Candidatus Thorarchaeota archaeon]NIW14307.1 hypothetical protein [Candidatus Thorarchaeota archaeon]NIW52404.1 hypothetical protein [Candidatus Korarchaeota archaeon]
MGKLLSQGKKRIDLLISLRTKEKITTDFSLTEEELIGHLALRISAALTDDLAFENWLLESEGDLFETRFRSERGKNKNILRDLFGEVLIGWGRVIGKLGIGRKKLTVELNRVLGRPPSPHGIGIIAFPFEKVPELVANRRGLLFKGWLITCWLQRYKRGYSISSAAKKEYQRQLRKRINQIAQKMEDQSASTEDLQSVAQEIVNYWKSKRRKEVRGWRTGPKLKNGKLYERVDLFPLCMSVLYSRITEEGYLGHGNRLQLGFFLKAIGMEVEEQLRFWYKFSVDDTGMSWKEFKAGPGYQIRHLYGLEGSGIDYKPPKCDTIINRYFCPYASLSQTELKKELDRVLPDSDQKERIRELSRRGEFQNACGLFLAEKTNSSNRKRIYHPLQFVRLASQSSGKEEVKQNGEPEER